MEGLSSVATSHIWKLERFWLVILLVIGYPYLYFYEHTRDCTPGGNHQPYVIAITVRFLFLTGNHDYVPDNQLPAETNQIYRNLTDQWENLGWFNGDANNKEMFSKCEWLRCFSVASSEDNMSVMIL